MLVCAPTGAGKTVVGEFAVFRALQHGGKCFYTTPIKALSNQKFADLVSRHGAAVVGLLTGDTAVNPHAPIVVMTTEVLRNMLYADSPDLAGLTSVVMDEIHYLADKFRGAVWEEVILNTDPSVQFVGLSATVSNAEEFAAWIQTVRGHTTVVVDEHRPVPLWQHMMIGRRMYDLFAAADVGPGGEDLPGAVTRIDPSLARAAAEAESRHERFGGPGRSAGRQSDRYRYRPGGQQNGAPRYRPPSRPDVIERLDGNGLLPAITFIFSRAGCDAAVEQCLRAGLRLTTEQQRAGDRPDRRPADRRPAGGRPRCARLLGVARGPGTRHRGAPRGHAAGVQGDGGGAVRRRAGQGGVRDRDAGARYQHAGQDRRARAAGQVQRRGPRRPDPRRVHPADRPGRPTWHRCRGPCGGALVAGCRPARRRRLGVTAVVPAAVEFPAELQHGRQSVGPIGSQAVS